MSRGSRTAVVALCLVLGIGTRAAVMRGIDEVLMMGRLHVDEQIYASGSLFTEGGAFDRPPGQFLLVRALAPLGTGPARLAMSLLSLVPALILASTSRGRWGALCAAALSVDPSLVLAGFQLLPETPAAVLAAAALLLYSRGGASGPGLLLGIASLFRPETLLILPLMFVPRDGRRRALRLALPALMAVSPVVLVNLISGAGPAVAANGSENLWLGSSLDLLRIPPGAEFEQLVAIDRSSGDTLLARWWSAVGAAPLRAALFAARKCAAALEIPGPGRNIDSADAYLRTGLAWLLPLTAAAVCLGLARLVRPRAGPGDRLAVAGVACLLIAAALFFPSERYRAAFLPFFYFAAASRPPGRADVLPAAGAGLAVVLCSLLPIRSSRPGLNYIVHAEGELESGDMTSALQDLHLAERSGFRGADLDNLAGIAMASSGDTRGALARFETALGTAPGAPSIWTNYALCLASLGRMDEARAAASRAAALRPSLRTRLEPLLR